MPANGTTSCLPLSTASMTMPALTAERRREVCIHEAAHAVVYALGGAFVDRVAVAPEHATEWTTLGRKGAVLTHLWGVCSASDPPCLLCLEWSVNDGDYTADRKTFTAMIRTIEHDLAELKISRASQFGVEQRRQLRAHVCAIMAGPVADAIHSGKDVEDELDWWDILPNRGDDLTTARAMTLLLPFRREYEHAVRVTEDVLRRPEVWDRVLRLAAELERVGDLDDVQPFLPDRLPEWPPSPRRSPLTRSPAPSTYPAPGRG